MNYFWILYLIGILILITKALDYVSFSFIIGLFISISVIFYCSFNFNEIKKSFIEILKLFFNFNIIQSSSFWENLFFSGFYNNKRDFLIFKKYNNQKNSFEQLFFKFFTLLELSITKKGDYFYQLHLKDSHYLHNTETNINLDLSDFIIELKKNLHPVTYSFFNNKYNFDCLEKKIFTLSLFVDLIYDLIFKDLNYSYKIKNYYKNNFLNSSFISCLLLSTTFSNNNIFPLISELQENTFTKFDILNLKNEAKNKKHNLMFTYYSKSFYHNNLKKILNKELFTFLPLNYTERISNYFKEEEIMNIFLSILEAYNVLNRIDSEMHSEICLFRDKFNKIYLFNKLDKDTSAINKPKPKINKI